MKLSSVMCAPLVSQGEVHRRALRRQRQVKDLFDRTQLELLSIFASQASLILQNAMLLNALRADKEKLVAELKDKTFGEIIGACPSMLEVFRKLQKVATTDISVLITGETGTGKELIATRDPPPQPPRRTAPSSPSTAAPSPRTSSRASSSATCKGAFTGAVMRRARQVPGGRQGHALPRRDRRAAAEPPGQAPARAAGARRLPRRRQQAREGRHPRRRRHQPRTSRTRSAAARFREDLYYRLNVVNLWLPPLRERGDDVLIIAKVLLSKYADELGSAVQGLHARRRSRPSRSTPGPATSASSRTASRRRWCSATRRCSRPTTSTSAHDAESAILPLEKAKEEFQRKYVLEVLERNNGNRTQTARDLGVDPRTIFRYLEREANPPPPGGGGGTSSGRAGGAGAGGGGGTIVLIDSTRRVGFAQKNVTRATSSLDDDAFESHARLSPRGKVFSDRVSSLA